MHPEIYFRTSSSVRLQKKYFEEPNFSFDPDLSLLTFVFDFPSNLFPMKTIAVLTSLSTSSYGEHSSPNKRFTSCFLRDPSFVEPEITSCESKPKPRQQWADEYKHRYLKNR